MVLLMLLSEGVVSAAPREVVLLPVAAGRQAEGITATAGEPWKLQHCEREIQRESRVSWEALFILDEVALW
jgi:hypothetical protein